MQPARLRSGQGRIAGILSSGLNQLLGSAAWITGMARLRGGSGDPGVIRPSETPLRYHNEPKRSVAITTINASLTVRSRAGGSRRRFHPESLPKQRAIHPRPCWRDPTGGTSMSITVARQLARQAEQARREAVQKHFTVQSLRRQQLID